MFGRLGIQFAVLMLCGPYHDLFRLAPGMVRAKGDKRETMNSESVRFGFVARSLIVLASVGAGTEVEAAHGCFCMLCKQQHFGKCTLAFEAVPKRCPLCLTTSHRACKAHFLERLAMEGGQRQQRDTSLTVCFVA